ncbi:MAG: hypothetical protein WB729_03230 [Candidatus Sulfotelmatobacter sp.]
MIALVTCLIAILGAWLWTSFAAPAICRAFGVPMVSGWRLARQNQRLTKPYYVRACGLFAIGSGLFLFFTLKQCLYCSLIVGRFPHVSGTILAVRLIVCLMAGWIFGVFTAPQTGMSGFPLR